jgi:hypothetical protein
MPIDPKSVQWDATPAIDPQTVKWDAPSAAAQQIANDPITRGAQNFTDDMGFTQKLNAGTGKVFSDIGLALRQRMGMASRADAAEARALDAPLMKTGAGVAGNVLGNVALLAPATLIPGAQAVPAAATIGAITGYLQPSVSAKEDAVNTALGAAGGAAGQWVANKAAGSNAFQQAQANQTVAKNAQKTAAAREANRAGYVVPPEDIGEGGGTVSRVLSGFGGKIKTAQEASARNQSVTDRLARQEIGLNAGDALSADVLQTIRNQAADKGYAPLRQVGAVPTDQAYARALNSISGKYQGAARSFPGAAKNEVADLVDSLRVGQFDAGDALDMVKVLRERADKAYRSGDNGLGKAAKSAANALEDQIERHLQKANVPVFEPVPRAAPPTQGANLLPERFPGTALSTDVRPDAQMLRQVAGDENAAAEMLKQFREARALIAKTYSVQKGLNSQTGEVSAQALAKQLEKGRPLSGNLKTIGETASAFPKATQSLKEAPKSFSPLDMAVALGGGAAVNPMLLAWLGRPIARQALLSNPMQQSALVRASTPTPVNAMMRALENENLMLPVGITAGNALARAYQ